MSGGPVTESSSKMPQLSFTTGRRAPIRLPRETSRAWRGGQLLMHAGRTAARETLPVAEAVTQWSPRGFAVDALGQRLSLMRRSDPADELWRRNARESRRQGRAWVGCGCMSAERSRHWRLANRQKTPSCDQGQRGAAALPQGRSLAVEAVGRLLDIDWRLCWMPGRTWP